MYAPSLLQTIANFGRKKFYDDAPSDEEYCLWH
jgi:hypothetical protein